jgi:hypothetical protein
MIDLQRRAEAGEDISGLVRWIATELVSQRPTAPHRRRS